MKRSRGSFLQVASAAAAGIAAGALPHALHAQGGASKSLRIGVIGSGRIGGTVDELWIRAGHEVMSSSPDLAYDRALAARVGIPTAGDDAAALDTAARRARDAGFEPVVVGPLAHARQLDAGAPVCRQALTASALQQGLGLKP